MIFYSIRQFLARLMWEKNNSIKISIKWLSYEYLSKLLSFRTGDKTIVQGFKEERRRSRREGKQSSSKEPAKTREAKQSSAKEDRPAKTREGKQTTAKEGKQHTKAQGEGLAATETPTQEKVIFFYLFIYIRKLLLVYIDIFT